VIIANHDFRRAITFTVTGALLLSGCSIKDAHPAQSHRERQCEAGNLYSQHDVGGDSESCFMNRYTLPSL
jgi:hypothetical protein